MTGKSSWITAMTFFTKFMFEVCKMAGITLYVTNNDIEDKIILTAYGDWEEVADDDHR